MAANRDIVEVLNFVGATDRFIAHEFEKHFLTLGIRAGLSRGRQRHAGILADADGHGVARRWGRLP